VKARRRPRERGFTLIELMIALVISSLLVGMILAIFMRMSLAYRGQQQVASVQQVLASARAMIETDAKQAGHQLPQGITIAMTPGEKHAPVSVINNSDSPDQVRFIYADATVQAAITTAGPVGGSVTVDDNAGFAAGDAVIIATPTGQEPNPIDPAAAPIILYASCLVRVTVLPSTTMLVLDEVAPYGGALNTHCRDVTLRSMVFKAVTRAYRIDPARPADGVLQMSPTGNLFPNAPDWQDLAYGFTDIQVATQFFDNDGLDTLDPDTDPNRDWHSGETQETLTAPIPDANTFIPTLQMTISLVSRTDRDVEGIATSTTPELTDQTRIDNNQLGDRPAVDLTTTTDATLQGPRIYRYVTFTNDFRNIGVGR
jgi:prepilin-type N-terminal cleavage/methylation domain-containing protein